MNLLKKIRAGALQFVLFIGAVIAVLLLTFVLLSHSHLFFARKANKFVDVVKKNDLALRMSMSVRDGAFKNLESDGITTTIEKAPWGLFNSYKSTSSFEKYQFTSLALIGFGNDAEQIPALYLKDNKRPLIIVGDAKLTGTVFLPEQGIRPGNISGESYFSRNLVFGNTKPSLEKLPQLGTELLQNIALLSRQSVPNKASTIPASQKMEFTNSFLEPTIFITGDFIDLRGAKLIGNIKVLASQKIVVDLTTALTDIILSAPKIQVRDGFRGSFQAFAAKEIVVGRNCLLEYPSALVVNDKSLTTATKANTVRLPAVSLASGSVLKGVLLYLNNNEERVFHPQVKIAQNAQVFGQLYCEKSLELKGKVYGSVYTDSFLALENGNVYQNHLYKGKINALELSQEFLGVSLGESTENKKIVKWLY